MKKLLNSMFGFSFPRASVGIQWGRVLRPVFTMMVLKSRRSHAGAWEREKYWQMFYELRGTFQMAFGEFKNIKQVLQKYPLQIKWEDFLPEVSLELPEWFLQNLKFLLRKQGPLQSEAFFCESFIFPFLQQAWHRHEKLMIWSHQSLVYDNQLFGEPDYFLTAWRDEVISEIINTPLLAVVEAKRQDFDSGWGQCLAAMLACQKTNQNDSLTIYGIVSTGLVWEFGKLEKTMFTRHPPSYAISDPAKIFGLLDHLFMACEKQIR